MKKSKEEVEPSWFGLDVDRKPPTALDCIQDQLGNEPLQMGRCPHCQRDNITTVTEQRASKTSLGLLFASLLFLGPYSFLFIPLISHFTADVHHICPRCETHLGISQVGFFNCLPKVHNDVITVKVGSCATIISKKLLYTLTGVIGGLFTLKGLFDYVQMTGLPDIPQGPLVTHTYSDWIHDCGMLKLRTNPLKVAKLFVDKWEGNSVEWNGKFNLVELGYFKKNTMMVEMEKLKPDDKIKGERQAKLDKYLALIFDDAMGDKVSRYESGDQLYFTATLLSQTTRLQPAILYLHEVYTPDEYSIKTATVVSGDPPMRPPSVVAPTLKPEDTEALNSSLSSEEKEGI